MAHADDWPKFLGPRGDGTSSESNLLDRFPPTGPQLLWHKPVGTGYSAPSIRGTRLVLHHRQGGEEIVECLDPASGAARWRYAYASGFVDPYGYNNGPRSSPLLTTNHCFTFGAEGRLVCLDLESGRLIWERDTAREWEIPEAFFGVGSSPVIEGNRLIVMLGGQPNSGVVALDPATGRTLWEGVGEKSWTGQPMLGWPGTRTVTWKAWDKQASYASPVVAAVHGQPTAFCLTRQGLVALEPATGTVLCSHWFRAQAEESVNAANPVVVDDLVLISAAYYRIGSVLLRVRPDRRGFDEVWRSTVIEAHWSTPILHSGHLYAFSGRNEPDARFRCVELKTGQLKWERNEAWRSRSAKQPAVYGRGAGILADGKLIVLGEGGLLGLFRPDPRGPDELARWQAPMLEFPCWTGPVLAEGRLFLRSEHHLVCVALR